MLIGVVYLFQRLINLLRLFNAKTILIEEQQWYYLTDCWRDKRFHTFTKIISLKMNIIMQLEFELAYYNLEILHISHYTPEIPLFG